MVYFKLQCYIKLPNELVKKAAYFIRHVSGRIHNHAVVFVHHVLKISTPFYKHGMGTSICDIILHHMHIQLHYTYFNNATPLPLSQLVSY